ncbi:50S ribosomal protein L22 [Clostridium frigidicarnis]|uniref:Large ribosomal subunit protein uL22 n=1 Tax=Clostridium frigidicarnis TaxID=84698 RepID=A0A1I0Z5I3_9CLOT|nr:50S ribosomal protein L22 [Clostridium frigidicarnis]SFB19708.1 LSU ribosomal protein L22P [Clostridium frigidicarnis]
MEAKAVAKYIRMSPMKVGVVLDLIRGKNVNEAFAILKYTPKDAAEVLYKLLKSAVANAENNNNLDPARLVVAEAHVGPAPILKRFRPRAQGRAYRINKRTSHITLVVKEIA